MKFKLKCTESRVAGQFNGKSVYEVTFAVVETDPPAAMTPQPHRIVIGGLSADPQVVKGATFDFDTNPAPAKSGSSSK